MADFTPELKGYNKPGAFRFWCQKVLPLVYDDSLSYYELLNKVVDYLNHLIEDNQATIENIGSLLTSYNQLQKYVNDYFTNLDVQKEINDKLDDMAEDGSLTNLISAYLDPLVTAQNNRIDEFENSVNDSLEEQVNFNNVTRGMLANTYTAPYPVGNESEIPEGTNGIVWVEETQPGTGGFTWKKNYWYYVTKDNGTITFAVEGGLYQATAVQTDKTLSVSDMAADAKSTGTDINNLNNGNLALKFIAREYCDVYDNGEIKALNTYSRTGYLPIYSAKILTISTTHATEYCAFYNANKGFISSFSLANGSNNIAVPSGAKYFIVSGLTENIRDIAIENEMARTLYDSVDRKYIFIGDSYCKGYNPDGNTTGWGERLKTAMQLTSANCTIAYQGGCGFYHSSNNKTFITLLDEAGAQVTKTDITDIVVCGGWNDNSDATGSIYNAILAFITKVRNEYPRAKLHIGMIANSNDPVVRKRLQDSVLYSYQYACIAKECDYLTNTEYALSVENLGSDGIHPNADGQVQIMSVIKQALDTGSGYVPHRFYDTEEKLENQISDLKEDLNAIADIANNLYDKDNVAIGKNWAGGDASNRATISIPTVGSETYTIFIPYNAAIPRVALIRVNPYNASLGSSYLSGGSQTTLTVEPNCAEIRISFEGNRTLTASDFVNYNIGVFSGSTGYTTARDLVAREGLANIKTTVDNIAESNKNICANEPIEVGKDWGLYANAKRAVILANVQPSTEYTIIIPENSNIDQINILQKATRGATVPTTSGDLNFGKNTLTTENTTFCVVIQFANFTTDFTADMFTGYIPIIVEGKYAETARDDVARSVNHWAGKRMVWLGTSIPAAGRYQIDNPKSYPIMVGNMLRATVYNEAVGSSALHCKDPARISKANPYGFLQNFEAVSRCITNSLAEMNWIIEHYNDSAVFTQNVPSSLTDADKEFIRSCSWEIKLQKYFTEDAFPDAWIIDHGHNDVTTTAPDTLYTAKTAIQGTRHDGYYAGGTFVPSTGSSYVEYDVTDQFKVWINGTFGSYYDVYDLYDADGNNIGKLQNSAAQTTLENFELDVFGASTLRVSNVNTLINTIGVSKLTYPMYENLYCYQGCLDFIVNKILTYNPRARILMIGEYENQKYPMVAENQEIAAKRWEFPLYKQWENLGWSQQPILVNGEWKRMLNIILPDNTHPHVDSSGFALEIMANNICGWLLTLSN